MKNDAIDQQICIKVLNDVEPGSLINLHEIQYPTQLNIILFVYYEVP